MDKHAINSSMLFFIEKDKNKFIMSVFNILKQRKKLSILNTEKVMKKLLENGKISLASDILI